ncbi:MAG: DUF418 domain-containing protein [Bacteroidota bacterium]
MEAVARPTQPSERIPSLDFLRGVAVLGILLINIETFAYPDSWSPYAYGFATEADRTTRFWVYFLAQGKFFSLFTLLFGVGFVLFLERIGRRETGLRALDVYARRLLWLFLIGVTHAYLIWDGDILFHYAVCGCFLFPFRSFRLRGLAFALFILAALVSWNAYERTARVDARYDAYVEAQAVPEADRSEEQTAAVARWERQTQRGEAHEGPIDVPRQTYGASIVTSYNALAIHTGQVLHRGLLFRTLIMMLLGVLLYRLGVFQDTRALRGYWLITLALLVVGLALSYIRYHQWTYAYFEPVRDVRMGVLLALNREVLTVAYVLLLNGLYQRFLRGLRFNPVSDAGRLALTNYISQSVLCGLLFYGYGLGWHGTFARHELLYVVVAIWALQLAASWLWCRRFRYGPLEWAWRRLTYGSFERESVAAKPAPANAKA